MRAIPFLSVLFFSAISPSLPAQTIANTIHVSGTATVKVRPDEIYVNCGVQTVDRNVEQAKARNDETIRRAIRFCTDHGVEAKNIQTDYVRLEPFHQHPDPDSIQRYRATQTLLIVVKDVGKYDELLTGLLKSGINTINSVEFATSELRKYRDEARRLAVQAAKEKAALYSKELGVRLGAIKNFSEDWWQWYPGDMGRANYSNMTQNMVQSNDAGGAGDSGEPSVSLGQILIRATVGLWYEN